MGNKEQKATQLYQEEDSTAKCKMKEHGRE